MTLALDLGDAVRKKILTIGGNSEAKRSFDQRLIARGLCGLRAPTPRLFWQLRIAYDLHDESLAGRPKS